MPAAAEPVRVAASPVLDELAEARLLAREGESEDAEERGAGVEEELPMGVEVDETGSGFDEVEDDAGPLLVDEPPIGLLEDTELPAPPPPPPPPFAPSEPTPQGMAAPPGWFGLAGVVVWPLLAMAKRVVQTGASLAFALLVNCSCAKCQSVP
jgi:hypothetical protein